MGAQHSRLRGYHEQSQAHGCLQEQVARTTRVCNVLENDSSRRLKIIISGHIIDNPH